MATPDGTKKRARTGTSDLLEQAEGSSPAQQTSKGDTQEPPLPKRVACTHCRQSKLRCDSPKDPCSRCERLGLNCTKDSGYKRVSKKSKIDELEKHVQELRDVLDHNRSAVKSPANGLGNISHVSASQTVPMISIPYPQLLPEAAAVGSSSEATTNATAPLAHPSDTSILLPQETTQLSDLNPLPDSYALNGEDVYRPRAIKARAIESTALAKEQIDSLFQIYFDNFHPFFPLLSPTRPPDEYYENSPLLFWTIVAIASRRYSEDASINSCLAQAIPKLAWEKIAESPLTYGVLHAILILCMWPFPDVHLWSDYSITYSNAALNAAFRMGLHRPEHMAEFTRNIRARRPHYFGSSDPLERRKTWAAANIVAQYMAVNVGFPPTGCCFDWSINRACEVGNPHTLPDELRYHLMIQRFSHRISKVMSINVSDPIGLPPDGQHDILMRLLEHDLNTLKGEIWDKLSAIDRIYFLAMQLQLGCYHWLGASSPDRILGILKSYTTATALIPEVLAADASFNALLYSPRNIPYAMLNAGYIILRILNSNLSQHVDCDAGATLFHSVVASFQRCAVQENDQSIRVGNILADMWYRRPDAFPNKSQEPFLVTRSRLGAGLIFDCLWRWKEGCLRAEGTASTNIGANGWSAAEKSVGAVENEGPPLDMNPLPFDWDLFDDLTWSWNFDISPATER